MFHHRIANSKTFTSIVAVVTMLMFCAGDAAASSTTVAPVLVPYTVTAIAGNNQSSIPGYGGDGQLGLNATLNGPNALAVDSVGNVYIADQSNALIREWNAQTGILKIIAGVPPSSCNGTTCTTTNPGCADGVQAVGSAVGSRVQGLVVDGYGNVYFSDYNYQGVWVIYHGGAQPANFISTVDATGVSAAGGVIPGYVYHVGGTAVPKAGGGCTGTSGTTDQVLATQAKFHDPLQMGIDASGNIYVQDYANQVVRVINTQATAQTFFGVSVQPGFVAAIIGCNKPLTTPCATSNPPFGSPAGGALYSSVLVGMTTDQYGNLYELDGKGANGGIYAGAGYAGGAPLANLINVESGLTVNVGGWYEVINSLTSTNAPTQAVQAVPANGSNDIVLRPNSIAVDPLGNLYMMDYHWTSIYRVDANSGMATRINGLTGSVTPPNTPVPVSGTNAAPTYCSGTSGPQTTDPYGDGCGIALAKFSTAGTGYVTFDGAGNLYVSDTGNNIVRKISVGTNFPATAVGNSVSQILQVHFDASNLPVTSGTAPSLTTNAFQVASGSKDFSITNTTCSNYTLGLDNSLECYVTVTFTPSSTGTRGASLQATTSNGTVYPFSLSGFGNGSHIVVDGGTATALPITGLGMATAAAVDTAGNVYVADPTNNQVVVSPQAGGKQTTIGTGLKGPLGVATDAAGNVYISDSGNNRVVKVAAVSGLQTVLATGLSNPHGLAVDAIGNIYVADTGNARVVEIPVFGELGIAPLLGYTGAQKLVTPVGVAIDKSGNVYVADTGITTGLVKISAGAGDLQPMLGSTSIAPSATLVGFGAAFVKAPSGIAIDGAGDIYVSDSGSNAILELSAASGPGSEPFDLNFIGLSGPTGLALDSSSNLYVADTGNSQILVDNRTNLALNFGNVYLHQTPGSIPLTVTNVGSTAFSPTSPFGVITGTNAGDFSETDTCTASNFPLGTLASGLHCGLTAIFNPATVLSRSATLNVQGGAATIALVGVGVQPQPLLTLSAAAPGGLVANQTATVTLTVTQPVGTTIPSGGQVTFSYTVNGVATMLSPVTLPASGITTFNLPTLLPGRQYVVNASYGGDAGNSAAVATPLSFYVASTPVTVTASSLSYVYGSPVPQPTGTVTGILPADQGTVTYTFSTTATPSSPVGSYPITVTFSGGNYQNYGFPTVYNADGKTPAVVTETKAPLTIAVENVTVAYGLQNVTFAADSTGLVNGDKPTITYAPSQTQPLNVGTYAITPTASIPVANSSYDRINNYAVTLKPGTLVITQGGSLLTISQAAGAVLPTALASGAITISATPPQAGLYGTPTGTVTITDVFTPLSGTGSGTSVTEPPIVLKLTSGTAIYTPTDPTIGVHTYQFAYSGDANFLPYSTVTATTLIVDQADFTVISTTTPIQVAPGIVPGGVATATGEQAATPEIANVYIAPILGSTAVVNLTCAVPASYITCTLTPATITLNGKTTQISVVAVSTPATLPVNFTAQNRPSVRSVVFALTMPVALLTLLPLFRRKRRMQISKLLFLFVALIALINATGCGGNLVKFFTPVPAGPTQVTVTGTSGSTSRSFVVPISIQ
jgi:sugar lactone lactonase YvrE